MDTIIAVVVTHNRKDLLSECISALRAQTRKIDKILVVNNGSTDQTQNWLSDQLDIEVINQANLGSAGGFFTAIKTGFESGYTWIWMMDDDGYPQSNALELLLNCEDLELSLRNCAIIDKEDRRSFVWRTKHFKTIDQVEDQIITNVAHPFNGTLLHRKIVERVGLPNPNLFLWGDETDYYYRIVRKNAIPFYTVRDSIHYHPATSFTIKTDWKYLSGWKMYYYIRNRYHVLKSKFYHRPFLPHLLYVGFLIVFGCSILIFQKTDRRKKFFFLFWPARDAFREHFSETPRSILSKLNIQQGNMLFPRMKGPQGIFSSS